MASQKRFELLTHGLEGRCSIQLSYWDSYLEGVPGFEPGNKGFADLCLTTWLYSHKMGRSMGIEPTNVGATIRCVNHFATTAIFSGRDSRNRTHTGGFGDLCSTVKLCPYIHLVAGTGFEPATFGL
jgi:hypothetical protein